MPTLRQQAARRDDELRSTTADNTRRPNLSSWLNQVERWFGMLTDQKFRRGAHRSIQGLETDISDWIKAWNNNPRPFNWTKTADEIFQRLASYLQRIPGAGH